jgi:hypothetical protein
MDKDDRQFLIWSVLVVALYIYVEFFRTPTNGDFPNPKTDSTEYYRNAYIQQKAITDTILSRDLLVNKKDFQVLDIIKKHNPNVKCCVISDSICLMSINQLIKITTFEPRINRRHKPTKTR